VILPDGTDYPRDYTAEMRRDSRGDLVYKLDWSDPAEREKYALFENTKFGGDRPIYPYDDHPVVRAYRRLADTADMRIHAHRESYLAFIAVATPADDYGVVSTFASRIQDAIQEQNEMENLEAHLARLDAIEARQDRIENELNDDARAQGDAASRAGHGELTIEVER
jgi:hypothetical protein